MLKDFYYSSLFCLRSIRVVYMYTVYYISCQGFLSALSFGQTLLMAGIKNLEIDFFKACRTDILNGRPDIFVLYEFLHKWGKKSEKSQVRRSGGLQIHGHLRRCYMVIFYLSSFEIFFYFLSGKTGVVAIYKKPASFG